MVACPAPTPISLKSMSIYSLAWFLDVPKSYCPPPDIVYRSRSDWGLIQRCITSNAIWHQSFYGFVQLRVMSRTTESVGFRSGANTGSRFEPPIAGVRGETVQRGVYEQISQTFISECKVNLGLDGTTFFPVPMHPWLQQRSPKCFPRRIERICSYTTR